MRVAPSHSRMCKFSFHFLAVRSWKCVELANFQPGQRIFGKDLGRQFAPERLGNFLVFLNRFQKLMHRPVTLRAWAASMSDGNSTPIKSSILYPINEIIIARDELSRAC